MQEVIFWLFQGANVAFYRHPAQTFLFHTTDGLTPYTSRWYVDAKPSGSSGAVSKVMAYSVESAVIGQDSVELPVIGPTFARKPTVWPTIKPCSKIKFFVEGGMGAHIYE